MSDIVSVKDFGAIGDGVANDTAAIQAAVDSCYGPAASPHGKIGVSQNRPLFFPAGYYRTTSPIVFSKVQGAKVFGAGRHTTWIENETPGGSTIVTNGCEYSKFEDFRVGAPAGGIAFDLNNLDEEIVGLQSNAFHNMFFSGGNIGVEIGRGGFMGSENLFLGCYFIGHASAGLKTSNWNALQNTVISGNFQSCLRGIWAMYGSVTKVDSVGFQANNRLDIVASQSANDTIVISACRSESPNFAVFGANVHALVQGCSHLCETPGHFVDAAECPVTVDRCVSIAGDVTVSNARLTVRGSSFGRMDWWEAPGGWIKSAAIEVEDVMYGQTPNGSGAGPKMYMRRARITNHGILIYPEPV